MKIYSNYSPDTQLYTTRSVDFVVPIFQAAASIKFMTISTGTRSALYFGLQSIDRNIPLPAADSIPTDFEWQSYHNTVFENYTLQNKSRKL